MHSRRADEVQAYVEALEAERMKMTMFKSELPLSIELVSQTIDACKSRLSSSGVQRHQPRDSSSEEKDTMMTDGVDVDVDVPVVEFIPLKKCTRGSSSESEEIKPRDDDNALGNKSDWLSSAQLWNKPPDLPYKSDQELKTLNELKSLVNKRKSSDKEKSGEKSASPKKAESSSTESEKIGGGRKKEDEESVMSKRKQRRCWSHDLHRRFLRSLKQLGGAHVATPKQIRELMKVDGLTNDEVKSHLQKYRLQTRRPTPPPSQSKSRDPPQFVVVGSIWAPSSDYTNMAIKPINIESGTSMTRVYTPMAAPPPAHPHSWQEPVNHKSQIKSNNPEGHGEGLAVRCISPSMSSSTRSRASQVY